MAQLQSDFQQSSILSRLRHKRINQFHSSLPQKSQKSPTYKLQNFFLTKLKTEQNHQNQQNNDNFKLKKCWQKLEQGSSLSKQIRSVYKQQQTLVEQQKKQINFVNFCKNTFRKERTTLHKLKTKYGKIVQIRRNHHLQQMQLKKQKNISDQQLLKQKLRLKQSIHYYKQGLQSSRIKLKQQKYEIANSIRYSLQISRKKCYQKQQEELNRRKMIYRSIRQQQQKAKESVSKIVNQKKRTINRLKLSKLSVYMQMLKKHKIKVNKIRQQSQQYERNINQIKRQAQSQIESYKRKLYLQNPNSSPKQQKTLATTITLFKNNSNAQLSFSRHSLAQL